MVPRFLNRRSIRYQLLAMLMVTSATVLAMAAVAFLTLDYLQLRADMRRELSIQARMVLDNSTAAMSFDDRAAARDTMQTLSPNSHIRLACLYTDARALFAEFRTADEVACPVAPAADGYSFASDSLDVTESVTVAGRPAGFIYLRSDLSALRSRLEGQLVTTGAILVVVLIAAFVLSSLFQKVVSVPIADLANTAKEVSIHGDYSLRAGASATDELNLLVDSFNEMLGEIQRAQNERIDLLHREREANRLKDEFLMTLSHELRTPLNAVLGWTRMLTAGVIPLDQAQPTLERIERNAFAQARLVEDLLEVSRFSTGKFRLNKDALDLVTVVSRAIEATEPAAVAREVVVEKRIDVASLPSVGDAERLEQVVWNLLSNAVKFSLPGGRVVVSLRRDGGIDEVKVSDSGVGIDPKFLPSVFEAFRQGDASSTRAQGGLGLGLAIVHHIVTMHGGHVSAASQGIGLGATFTLRLPAIHTQGSNREPQLTTDAPAVDRDGLMGVKVLIVDDDADSREMLASALRTGGAAVQSASSTSEALQISAGWTPDVLISDLAMPHQDGYVLLLLLKDLLGPTMPRLTIAVTAQAGNQHRERALSAGFQQHLAKPVDPLAVIRVIQGLVSDQAASVTGMDGST